MKQRIYIDTSVVGGYFDEEFREPTRKLFKRLNKGEIIFVISDLLDLELSFAPQIVKQLLHHYPPENFDRLKLNKEAIELADTYIAEKVVGKTSLVDCKHIALAEGFDKHEILVVFNAGVNIKPQHSLSIRGFYFCDKAEDGQKNSFAKPSCNSS